MKAAQTHGGVEVRVQTVCLSQEELQVVGEVQHAGGGEAHQEDDEDQRADLDVGGPVLVRPVQLADDPGVAHGRDHQGHQEAEDGQEEAEVNQVGVGALCEG